MNFSINTIMLCVGIGLVLFIIVMAFGSNAMGKAIKEARQTKNAQPIIDAIDKDPNADIKSLFNGAIKQLWDSYDREVATDLIKAFLERIDRTPIAQFWLKTVLEVEPELARKKLGADFIQAHTHEDCAAKSSCGGCGGGKCGSGKCGGSCK